MQKRVVLLEIKDTGESCVFKSVVELMRAKRYVVGITLGALWNALAKKHGVYENKRCRVSYQYL